MLSINSQIVSQISNDARGILSELERVEKYFEIWKRQQYDKSYRLPRHMPKDVLSYVGDELQRIKPVIEELKVNLNK